MNNKLNTIAKYTENNTEILFFRQDNDVDTYHAGHDFKLFIQASKPVLFTLAVNVRGSLATDGETFVALPRCAILT
jgi:hypothetical protein